MCFVVYYELYKNPFVSSPRPMRIECEIARIAGLRVDAVPYPVLSLHPDARRKQARIWCSDRPAEIYLAAMLDPGSRRGLLAGLAEDCPTPVESNLRPGRATGVRDADADRAERRAPRRVAHGG